MRNRTDRARNADESRNPEKNGSEGAKRNEKRNRIIPESFIETGKGVVKSVIFWCAAVSIAASACHAAMDAAAAFSAGKFSERRTAEAPLDITRESGEAGKAPSGVPRESGETVAASSDIMRESGEAVAASSGVPRESGETVKASSAVRQESGSAAEAPDPVKKTAALTFDDGPHPVYTKKLLDGLLERNVKATFFVIGENIPGNEDLIRRMEDEGHLIGNHTYNHVKICDMAKEDACYQVEQTSALVREITGHDTEFVRPPFGAWNPELECSFVMLPVLWDVDPLDWTTSNTPLVVQRIEENTKDQDIILLHDVYESSVDAALQIVDILKKEGFEFVTVDKLILP